MPKPVVMAVDDDPVAIDRIGEELRRRYGLDCLGTDPLGQRSAVQSAPV